MIRNLTIALVAVALATVLPATSSAVLPDRGATVSAKTASAKKAAKRCGKAARRAARKSTRRAVIKRRKSLCLARAAGKSLGKKRVTEPAPTPTPTPVVTEPAPTPTPVVTEPEPTPVVTEPEPTPVVTEPEPTPAVTEPEPITETVTETVTGTVDHLLAPLGIEWRPFTPGSYLNTDQLLIAEPLDLLSDTYVSELRRQVGTYGSYINTTSWSVPVYNVKADHPTVRVQLVNKSYPSSPTHVALQEAWEQVPMPPNARPATGTDMHLVIYQPETDRMWEFYRLAKQADGRWTAAYGGYIDDVSANPGTYTQPYPGWGATATSIPLQAGLMRIKELEAGNIDHALALALPDTRKDAWSWPAKRSDGQIADVNAIPEGTRFRIPSHVDLSVIPMSPIVRQMARAVKRYGMVVRDGAGSVAFYGEDPTPTGTNPYAGATGFFGGKSPSVLMAQFPWDKLVAIKTQMTVR